MKEETKLKLSQYVYSFLLGVLLYFMYLAVRPYNVITINKLPYPVIKDTITAGSPLILLFDYCKHIALPTTYTVQFIGVDSGVITTFEQRLSSNIDKGCHVVEYKVSTPKELDPGRYFARLIYTYKVNFLRDKIYTFDSQVFNVTERQDKIQTILNILQDWQEIK